MAARLADMTPYYAEDGIVIYFCNSLELADDIARSNNRHEYVYREEIAPLIERHGWGKIPWRLIDPAFTPTDIAVPDLGEYVVPSLSRAQLSLLARLGEDAAE